MNSAIIATIAKQEARIGFRNRWTVLFAAVFGLLSLTISYFGLVTQASTGFQSFERTVASLLSLVLYLVPIVSLSMATLSFTGEPGSSELLFSQPVTRLDVLLGKLIGLLLSISTAILFGFGLSGAIIASQIGAEGFSIFASFGAVTLLLAAAFLAIGALVAVLAVKRTKALGAALLVWFFFVLFYDLLIVGGAFLLKERTANQFIFLSLFGNPVDAARVASLIAVGDPTIFGAAGAMLTKFLGGRLASQAILLVTLLGWTVSATSLAGYFLRKRDI